MQNPVLKRLFLLGAVVLALWLGLRYTLPVVLPFAMGAVLAVAAEPLVKLCTHRLRLPRTAGAIAGVTATLIMVLTILVLLLSILLRELGQLARILPDMEQTARQGLSSLEDFLLQLASRTPDGMRGMLTRWVLSLFGSERQWIDGVTRHLPGIASSILGHIPGGALAAGTAVISGYMISARLPDLRSWTERTLPAAWKQKVQPTVTKLRHCLGSWLTAQLKLCAVSFCILSLGLMLLGIRYAPLWGLLIALVDALPVLGSGTVLLPWAVIRLIQGSPMQALGLIGVYAAAALTRSVLEPKLLGKQLGLDPLVTLVALYAGFRLWGFAGMILSPMLAMVTVELVKAKQ